LDFGDPGAFAERTERRLGNGRLGENDGGITFRKDAGTAEKLFGLELVETQGATLSF
jgi:hypothetical protein